MLIHCADLSQQLTVTTLEGSREVQECLADLGFTPGTPVSVVSRNKNSVIIKVRNSHIMLNNTLASSIKVQ